ncbi:tryptophan halogenase family protein [Gilvimarinus polysaccharolyticus]|uniref:tryptophan halogenase family protein n=1 Tax=Gilvimarinus polysaccharolyticus TaxID=863921 RepID=UPI000673407E|nr:tryptophan halogenase family protein [Gilvimarinus polysaccharolyticus]
MSDNINKVVILGGGTAGWITAGLLAAMHDSEGDSGVEVVVIESPDVSPIGVGEGTWPSMRDTLKKIGVSESEFISSCNVSFKQGSKFIDWSYGQGESYYHPFTPPSEYGAFNLAPYWLQNKNHKSFSETVCAQPAICERGLAPKQIVTPEYAYVVNYGYHLDSSKFSKFLRNHCVNKLGVGHKIANVTHVVTADDGYINALGLDSEGPVEGDLFVDCSGFKSLLLGQHYGVENNSLSSVLINDRALATQVVHEEVDAEISSCTLGTAQKSGWIWDIALPNRRGIGYVYSSSHASSAGAEATAKRYILNDKSKDFVDQLEFRHIKFNPGYRKCFWYKNCLAIGLSAGFIEPLEATALVLVENSAQMLANEMPRNRTVMSVVARRFNQRFTQHWEKITDFLKLHYVLSRRDDSDYWKDHRCKDSVPDSLSDLLILWGARSPWVYDESARAELFPSASFQYVLYGMRPDDASQLMLGNYCSDKAGYAEEIFIKNQLRVNKLIGGLQSNRELLEKIKNVGLSRI